MKTFNLSRWALEHKSFVVYLMLVVTFAGIFAYRQLGRDEDPPFTIKTMVVKTLWPGATTLETMQQVTDRIEKKLEELPNIDYQKSYTEPGESVVFVYLKDSTPASDVPDLWYQVRKKVGDIKQTLPQGVQGPFFNDEFGDTYALIFALTSDGFSHRELRDYAERVRAEMLRVTDVAKIDLLGTQDENLFGVLYSAARSDGARHFRADTDVAGAKCDPAEWDSRLQSRKDRDSRLGSVHVRSQPESNQFSLQWPVLSVK
jgi:multidrug efflux pump subunit AcrB